ncbi:hypothetical protein MMK62_006751 [Pseudomonas aeruginosa]|uniref:hypothetical protein n=2 Tax=Pseudomonas aeruginosa TaxID=287 RepID=UPI000940F8C2|nr:hypothetical protein [Pseudomonas aeruginosa]EIU4992779.1 hypothetical protein [Pseudomonas aeruginosa]EIY2610867.1 hypothetical protein [Pseudomonas aeruginosa]EIY2744036.1 hypothetical protein [Pseudomonas aeruginosa]EKM0201009.1 hypothetical protein [Pseudomonas aeruginosa]EKM0220609.1 hypothetical protein [Pseudomonas aeruginosa]
MSSTPYRTPDADLNANPEQSQGGYLSGGKPLWKAFWLFHLLGLVVLYALVRLTLDSLGETITELVRSWNELILLTAFREVYGLLGFTPLLFYVCFSSVVVWRCSRNTRWGGWTVLARLVVSLNTVLLAGLVAYCLWILGDRLIP